ncbi:MAG: proline racemase [Alphaproteobacteria bacterium]|nr:proline racemase [Alphaproteobacteria bacterium]
MHTGGEPVRIIVAGYPELKGRTLLEKRRDARDRLDHLRRRLMHEPRGHFDMYGALPVPADHPDAAFAVLFLHNEGYSTMCGHATIALGRWAVESGRVPKTEPETRFVLQCPCGPVAVAVEVEGGRAGRVRFESVPAFAAALDRKVAVPGFGTVSLDVGYGGAFYAVLPAERLGLDMARSPLRALVDAATAVTQATKAAVPLDHPDDRDLAFLYGTILTDGGDGKAKPSINVCVFAEREVDRSPTGSGVIARLALAHARDTAKIGERHVFESLTGARFDGHVARETRFGGRAAVTIEVGGGAYYTGSARFTAEDGDPLKDGFLLRP